RQAHRRRRARLQQHADGDHRHHRNAGRQPRARASVAEDRRIDRSGGGPLQPRNVDVNATVLDIAKLLRPTLGEQIEVNSILEQETATAHIDASQLANSLLNMAINARDAMPNGGKLLLETRKVVLDEAYAQVNPDVKPGPYVMLAVSDTGTGMSREVLDKVF